MTTKQLRRQLARLQTQRSPKHLPLILAYLDDDGAKCDGHKQAAGESVEDFMERMKAAKLEEMGLPIKYAEDMNAILVEYVGEDTTP